MKTTAKLALFVLLATAVNFLNAQGVSKYSNEFLSIGVGARALGMGTSVISSTGDISATYWKQDLFRSQHNTICQGYQHYNSTNNHCLAHI